MGEGGSRSGGGPGDAGWAIVDTHVRLAPGCSAYGTVPDAVTTDDREGVLVFTASDVSASRRHTRAESNAGFPDGPSRIRRFSELGADLIDAASRAVAR